MNSVEQAVKVRDSLLTSGIYFGQKGEIPWRISPTSFPLSSQEFRELEVACIDFKRLLVVTHGEIANETPLGRRLVSELGGNQKTQKLRLALTKLNPGYNDPVPMIRPDLFWDKNGVLTCCEIETMIGGLGMAEVLRTAYGGSMKGTAKGYADMLWFNYEKYTKAKSKLFSADLTVAIVIPEAKANYDSEFECFSQALKQFNISLLIVRPSQIEIRTNGQVYFQNHELQVIHRFFRICEFVNNDELALFTRIAQESNVLLIQPWKEILEEKGIFAFFHDESLKEFWLNKLGQESFGRLVSCIPETFFVNSDNDFRLKDIFHSTRSTRAWWLKKSGNTWGGKGVYFGSDVTNTKWQQTLEGAINDFQQQGEVWILQRSRECEKHSIVYLDNVGSSLCTEESRVRINPFFFSSPSGDNVSDCMVTARKESKVHGATNSTFMVAKIIP